MLPAGFRAWQRFWHCALMTMEPLNAALDRSMQMRACVRLPLIYISITESIQDLSLKSKGCETQSLSIFSCHQHTPCIFLLVHPMQLSLILAWVFPLQFSRASAYDEGLFGQRPLAAFSGFLACLLHLITLLQVVQLDSHWHAVGPQWFLIYNCRSGRFLRI